MVCPVHSVFFSGLQRLQPGADARLHVTWQGEASEQQARPPKVLYHLIGRSLFSSPDSRCSRRVSALAGRPDIWQRFSLLNGFESFVFCLSSTCSLPLFVIHDDINDDDDDLEATADTSRNLHLSLLSIIDLHDCHLLLRFLGLLLLLLITTRPPISHPQTAIMSPLERFSKWIQLKIYQFEVTYSVNMLTPMEKFFVCTCSRWRSPRWILVVPSFFFFFFFFFCFC